MVLCLSYNRVFFKIVFQVFIGLIHVSRKVIVEEVGLESFFWEINIGHCRVVNAARNNCILNRDDYC